MRPRVAGSSNSRMQGAVYRSTLRPAAGLQPHAYRSRQCTSRRYESARCRHVPEVIGRALFAPSRLRTRWDAAASPCTNASTCDLWHMSAASGVLRLSQTEDPMLVHIRRTAPRALAAALALTAHVPSTALALTASATAVALTASAAAVALTASPSASAEQPLR